MWSVQSLGFAYSLVLCFVMIETGSGDSSNVQTHEDYRYLPSRRADHGDSYYTEEVYHGDAAGYYGDLGGYHSERTYVGDRQRKVITRVRYSEPREKRVRVVTKKRKRVRPVVHVHEEANLVPIHRNGLGAVHPVSGFEGSYVAVAGDPSRGSVHVVENVPALGRDSITVVNGVRVRNRPVVVAPPPAVLVPVATQRAPVLGGGPGGAPFNPVPLLPGLPPVDSNDANRASTTRGVPGDRLPLPACSYVNTDFPGDNLVFDDGTTRGLNAGSARGCKALCRLEETCSFWSYREGFNRDLEETDCFLKAGTPGLPVPREAVPRIGFVSGTKDNNCICIMSDDEEDEVCPIKDPQGGVYPWRSTDQEQDDIDRGLLPSGWRRRNGDPGDPYSTFYGGYNGRVGGGSAGGLEDDIRSLRAQLDLITRRLGEGK